MAQCTNNIVDENIDFCPNDEVASGVSETELYVARVSDFSDIKEIPSLATVTSYAEAATISETHTFLAGKGFTKLNVLADTGNVTSESVGSKGAKSFTTSLAGTLPGTSARNKGFGRAWKNAPLIAIAKARTGEYVQIGSKSGPAFFDTFSPNTGTAPEDVNGIPFVISATTKAPAPVYGGDLTLIEEASS